MVSLQGWSPCEEITEQRLVRVYTLLVFEFLISSEVEDGELVFSILYLQAGRLL